MASPYEVTLPKGLYLFDIDELNRGRCRSKPMATASCPRMENPDAPRYAQDLMPMTVVRQQIS